MSEENKVCTACECQNFDDLGKFYCSRAVRVSNDGYSFNYPTCIHDPQLANLFEAKYDISKTVTNFQVRVKAASIVTGKLEQ